MQQVLDPAPSPPSAARGQECRPEMVAAGEKWKLCVQKQTIANVHDMWEIASKFCGVKLWMPDLQVCEHVDGTDGQPGCVRFCAGTIASHGSSSLVWVKEQLLTWDPELREYSYNILDSNLGFENYTATLSLSDPCNEGFAYVTWKVELSPVYGYGKEEFLPFLGSILETHIASLEKASHSLSSQKGVRGG